MHQTSESYFSKSHLLYEEIGGTSPSDFTENSNIFNFFSVHDYPQNSIIFPKFSFWVIYYLLNPNDQGLFFPNFVISNTWQTFPESSKQSWINSRKNKIPRISQSDLHQNIC
jgi:hypothetical protein